MSVEGGNFQGVKAWRWGPNIICRTGWEKYQGLLMDYLASQEKRLLKNEKEISDLMHLFWEHCKTHYGLVNYQAGSNSIPWLNMDSDFMVVNGNGIFLVATDLSVARYNRFHATGSGRDWALGAASALYDKKSETARAIARQAAKIACAYNVHCGGQLKLLEVR